MTNSHNVLLAAVQTADAKSNRFNESSSSAAASVVRVKNVATDKSKNALLGTSSKGRAGLHLVCGARIAWSKWCAMVATRRSVASRGKCIFYIYLFWAPQSPILAEA